MYEGVKGLKGEIGVILFYQNEKLVFEFIINVGLIPFDCLNR